MTVGFPKWDTVVTIPRIGDRLPRAAWYPACKFKWGFGCKRFPTAKFVQRGQVNGPSWCAVMLPSNYHTMAPRCGFTMRRSLEDAKGFISKDIFVNFLLPMKWDGSRGVERYGLS